jgi:hypothetical protein
MMRSRDFRASLREAVGTTEQHVIIVLPDDHMGYVFQRLHRAGSAVLVMPSGGSFVMAVLTPASAARQQVAAEDDSLTEVHDQIEVGMLFGYLRGVPGAVVCRALAARLLCGPEVQPV